MSKDNFWEQYFDDSSDCEKALRFLLDRERQARKILCSGRGRQDERLREVARYMGWVTDKKSSKYDAVSIFWEYLDLFMGTYDPDTYKKIEPIEKSEAIKILAEKYKFPSASACYKFLSRYIEKRRKDGDHIPPILPRDPSK